MFSMLLATTIAAAANQPGHGTNVPAPLSVVQTAGQLGKSISIKPLAAAPLSVNQVAAPSAGGHVAGTSTAQHTQPHGSAKLAVRPLLSVSVQSQHAPAQATPLSAPQQSAAQPAAQPAAPAQPPAPTYPYTSNPQADLVTVGRYLMNDGGYSAAGAAGVAGCIQGESGGSPEATQGYAAGGAGLIQWTPETSIYKYGGSYGGNPQADFSSQLGAIIRYNNTNGNVAKLNAISNPVDAADYYSQNFERPLVVDSDVRPANAIAVYSALTAH